MSKTQLRPMGADHSTNLDKPGKTIQPDSLAGLLNPEMQRCIEDCQRCHSVCLTMAAIHCLESSGKHVEPVHFRTMLDCAEICQTGANFMLRNSAFHASICRACADVCGACAKSCEEIGDMQECVEICRRCAESCQKMAA